MASTADVDTVVSLRLFSVVLVINLVVAVVFIDLGVGFIILVFVGSVFLSSLKQMNKTNCLVQHLSY